MISCPSCERSFENLRGVRMHHTQTHGESLSYSTYECCYCSKKFERQKSKVRGNENNFCSRDCQSSWQSENLSGVDSPNWEGGGEEVKCEYCGEVKMKPSAEIERSNKNFCSRNCFTEWKKGSDDWEGEEHPAWTGGGVTVSLYGSDWIEFAEEIRRRDSYECFFCKISSEAHKVTYGRELEVHHLVSPKIDLERNQDPSNVITLCIPCHRRIERV